MAVDLKLDSVYHDLTVANFDLQLVTEEDQIAQKLKCRLNFFSEEWFLDITQGVDLYGVVYRKNPDLALITTLFKSVILDTTGVLSITSYNQVYDARQRTLTIDFTVDTVYGPVTVTTTY